MDHLEFIKLLLDKGADVNARVKDSTETRTVFTNQWLDENGATAFLRASQSGDLELMKLLLARGADPKIDTLLNVTPLQVAAGIGWVEGITTNGPKQANARDGETAARPGHRSECSGQYRAHRAARRGTQGRPAVIQMLVDYGGDLAFATTATPTTAAASSPFIPGRRWTTPTVSCASACNPPSRIPRQGCSFEN